MAKITSAQLKIAADRSIKKILESAYAFRGLKTRIPGNFAAAPDISIVGSSRMRSLNDRYRKKNYATDILSFEAPDFFRAQGYLGELVICSSVLQRQAKEQGHSPLVELDVLLVHGFLHLLGFDHEGGPKDAKEMALWERKLLSKIRKIESSLRAQGLIGRADSSLLRLKRSDI
jgi:rRNA maturation RNase YbeY